MLSETRNDLDQLVQGREALPADQLEKASAACLGQHQYPADGRNPSS